MLNVADLNLPIADEIAVGIVDGLAGKIAVAIIRRLRGGGGSSETGRGTHAEPPQPQPPYPQPRAPKRRRRTRRADQNNQRKLPNPQSDLAKLIMAYPPFSLPKSQAMRERREAARLDRGARATRGKEIACAASTCGPPSADAKHRTCSSRSGRDSVCTSARAARAKLVTADLAPRLRIVRIAGGRDAAFRLRLQGHGRGAQAEPLPAAAEPR